MPGCKDRCYLYMEEHTLNHLEPGTQIRLEKELEKFERGEEFDTTLLNNVVKRSCLGEYMKIPGQFPVQCRHYWELPEELSVATRMTILEGKKNRLWKRLTITVSIAGIIMTSVFAWLNFSKHVEDDLKNEIKTLKQNLRSTEAVLVEKDKELKQLQSDLKKSEKANE